MLLSSSLKPEVAYIDVISNEITTDFQQVSAKISNQASTYYDTHRQFILGDYKNFLTKLSVSEAELAIIVREILSEYSARLACDGLNLISTPDELQEGILVFRQKATVKQTLKFSNLSYDIYRLYANGQLWTELGITRKWVEEKDRFVFQPGIKVQLHSPRPKVIPGAPQQSLIETYSVAIDEMLAKYQIKLEKMQK